MSDPIDLKKLLQAWPYDPEQDARIVRLADGREVLQVRLAMGLEQHELEGRPDGLRPHGRESHLDYHFERLAQAKEEGAAKRFELNTTECEALFQEGILYYERYVRLFQLQDWARTERDTARNLRLFDFVQLYAAREDDREYLEKWRPYLLRMNAIARAMIAVDKERHAQAQSILRSAIEVIESLPEQDDDTFRMESRRSLAALKHWLLQIDQTRPLGEVERLERELQQAISTQAFERAAELRDRLRDLRGPKQQTPPE